MESTYGKKNTFTYKYYGIFHIVSVEPKIGFDAIQKYYIYIYIGTLLIKFCHVQMHSIRFYFLLVVDNLHYSRIIIFTVFAYTRRKQLIVLKLCVCATERENYYIFCVFFLFLVFHFRIFFS